MSTNKHSDPFLGTEIESGTPREIPESMKKKKALAYNQNQLAVERTEFAKIRTELAFTNSRLAIDRTHLAYLRTIVSLIGSGATVYKALPVLGISQEFTALLTAFLLIAAVYFIYKDVTTYPKMKQHLEKMEQQASTLAEEAESHVYRVDNDI
ncbi:MAG: DUF202 domain-containing protein [Bacteroidales bacterium]|nr:DUF202 domain-containing protein [Clostridium sp.]MCM1203736.1 DUF202 domain-containing protein [Bacteroidales bacterium]